MNILLITPYIPYKKANHAGGVVTAHNIEELRKNNNVFVLSFDQNDARDFDENRELIHISTFDKCMAAISNLKMPLLFSIRKSGKFLAEIFRIIKEQSIDAVHIDYSQMGQYARAIKERYPDIKINLFMHDVCTQIYERLEEKYTGIAKYLVNKQKQAIHKYENEYVSICDNIIVTSDKDRQLVSKYYGRNDAKVVVPYFGLSEKALKRGNDICFLGKMDRTENTEAAQRLIEIYNLISPTEAELYIIGANPPATLKEKETSKIHVTGFVDDTDEYMSRARVAVFPLNNGAGIKIKVLNAMSMGIPVITTSVGAEGIDPEGNTLVLADSNEDFVNKINSLYYDIELCDSISRREVQLIEENFSWKKTQKVLNELYY